MSDEERPTGPGADQRSVEAEAAATATSSGGETAAPEDGNVGEQDGAEPGHAEDSYAGDAPGSVQTVTTYRHGEYGHRVTRRTVRRREVTEDTVETITEEVPPAAYQAPRRRRTRRRWAEKTGGTGGRVDRAVSTAVAR